MKTPSSPRTYRFTFGPWNIHTGADPFGPPVRPDVATASKLREYRKLGFDGVQVHDDDVVPADLSWAETQAGVKEFKKIIDGEGLFIEIVAPRLWEHPSTIDGGYTANDAKCREYALARSKRTIDIANMLQCPNLVLWLAREGTYIREAKDPQLAIQRILDAINAMLAHDKAIRILGEMKPNEPMDQSYLPTVGHFLALTYRTDDPQRVGTLIESAHSILAGLDPSDDMAFALWTGKLWSVHLNDQNGLKYDQDKTFGSVDLRRAFNTIWVLERGGYDGSIGLDVKAMRSTRPEQQTLHLANSRAMFLRLLDVVRALNVDEVERLRQERNYEALEMLVLNKLMGM